jgi:hypothetical protein
MLTMAVLGTIATRRGASRWLAARVDTGVTGHATRTHPAMAHVAPAASIRGGGDPAGSKIRRATIRAGRGAEGARVVLVSGSDERVLPALPVTVEIPSGAEYSLIATRPGYASTQLSLVLDEGKAVTEVEISLQKVATTASRAFTEAARTFATVDLRSTPWSTVILDGKAIGSCPRLGVVVTAGEHSALFAGEVGQKRVTFSVRPGETKTISVRL